MSNDDDFIPPKVNGAPERIWLVVGEGEGQDVAFGDCDEVSWCEHRVFDMDVEYVRAAASASQAARIAELEEREQRLQRALAFWLPGVVGGDEVSERAGDDAMLLAGYDGPNEPSAEDRGWITARPKK
jgi:hypothetical protein